MKKAQHTSFQKKVIQFAQNELANDILTLDKQECFDRAGWDKCAAFGIHALLLPKAYGGRGLDVRTTIAGLEGLGYGCTDNGLLFAINAHIWACQMPILTFGSDAQKAKYLPKLGSGEWIGGHAITEPQSGSDVYSMAATAQREGDRYILNGHKSFVSNGVDADMLVAFANVDPDGGKRGVTAFLIDMGTSGLIVKRQLSKVGTRTAPTAEIVFENCAVPVENRLGKEGAGLAIFSHSMEWERGFILASAVGAMERVLEQTVRYARRRKQFGQPIGKFQQVSSKLVDMKLRLENARAHLYKVAELKQQGKMAIMEAAIAKLTISEAWVQNSLDAMQIHGGYGYTMEAELDRQLRDALGSRIYSGTSEIQKNIIAQFMGL